jgi:hypothetical protein
MIPVCFRVDFDFDLDTDNSHSSSSAHRSEDMNAVLRLPLSSGGGENPWPPKLLEERRTHNSRPAKTSHGHSRAVLQLIPPRPEVETCTRR